MIKAVLQIKRIEIKQQDLNIVHRLLKNRMKIFQQKQAKHFTGDNIKMYLQSKK